MERLEPRGARAGDVLAPVVADVDDLLRRDPERRHRAGEDRAVRLLQPTAAEVTIARRAASRGDRAGGQRSSQLLTTASRTPAAASAASVSEHLREKAATPRVRRTARTGRRRGGGGAAPRTRRCARSAHAEAAGAAGMVPNRSRRRRLPASAPDHRHRPPHRLRRDRHPWRASVQHRSPAARGAACEVTSRTLPRASEPVEMVERRDHEAW